MKRNELQSNKTKTKRKQLLSNAEQNEKEESGKCFIPFSVMLNSSLVFANNPVIMLDCISKINSIGRGIEDGNFITNVTPTLLYCLKARAFSFVASNEIFEFFYLLSLNIQGHDDLFQVLQEIDIFSFFQDSLKETTNVQVQEYILTSTGNFILYSEAIPNYFCQSSFLQFLINWVPFDIVIRQKCFWVISNIFTHSNETIPRDLLINLLLYLKSHLRDIDDIQQQCLKGLINACKNINGIIEFVRESNLFFDLLQILQTDSVKSKRLTFELISIISQMDSEFLNAVDVTVVFENIVNCQNRIVKYCFDLLINKISRSINARNEALQCFQSVDFLQIFGGKDFLAKSQFINFIQYLAHNDVDFFYSLFSEKLVDEIIEFCNCDDPMLSFSVIDLFLFASMRNDNFSAYFAERLLENREIFDSLEKNDSFDREQIEMIELFYEKINEIQSDE